MDPRRRRLPALTAARPSGTKPAVSLDMNEDPQQAQKDTTTPPPTDDEPALQLVEPEDMGGESACWAHLLDDECRLEPERR